MKILCFSDLHRDVDAAKLLVESSHDADLVIGAGDFANRHEGLSDTIDILKSIARPTVLVPGNGETFEELVDATSHWPSATILHGSGVELTIDGDEISVWGVGGGIPVTPFGDWSYDFDEDQAAELLRGCPENALLVTHSPPIDSVDHDSSGKIRGSVSIRDCVEARKPQLCVCGHIHSDWTRRVMIGSTTVLNAGPVGQWVSLNSSST